MIKVKTNNFIASIIWGLVTIVEVQVLNTLSYSIESIRLISVIAFFNCIMQIFTCKALKGQIISFFTAFVVFLYIGVLKFK